ncbi:MAG: acetylglutamate kinase [Bacteroidetes bacterium]|nr:acetylglutamate kinase [Bacteroidota bacterium]
MKELIIVKIGGNVIGQAENLKQFLSDFCELKGHKILVHGGGKLADQLSQKLGYEVKLIDGRRITDESAIKVVTMVYGGLINKQIVAALQGFKCNAMGLTGADANLILSHKRPDRGIDYGYVGDIDHVDAVGIQALLEQGITPVFAALTHDGQGNLLNTNADTIAASLATAASHLFNVRLIYCFEKKGVLTNISDDDSIINCLSYEHYQELRKSGTIAQGMLPKLDNAFETIGHGVKEVIICHAGDLKKITLDKESLGTKLEF